MLWSMKYVRENNAEVASLGESVAEQFLKPADQAKALPGNSGVYLMLDKDGTVIYVGKAKNLRKRVMSYFLSGRNAKTAALVEKIHRIEHIITGNEYEALVLENNLIKKYNPHYNIDLKDGKSYPMIRITKEDFPKVFKTRRLIKDGSLYFGPYPGVGSLDTYLELVNTMFRLRKCASPMKRRDHPCLYYHIGRCSAPCCGMISKEAYAQSVEKVKKFLNGDNDRLIRETEKEMLSLGKELKFEEAAKKRDLLRALVTMATNQTVEDQQQEARDYAAIEMRGPLYSISLMQVRDGALMGRALYRGETLGDETETLQGFLLRYYADGQRLPKQLYVSHDIDSMSIARFFDEQLGGKLQVLKPVDGKHYRILRMAGENATRDVEKRLRSTDNSVALEALQQALDLPSLPVLIEGFDIAQLSGKYTVASLISFRDGKPDKQGYRRFNIRSLGGKIDDFQSMREAATRRYQDILNEGLQWPSLVVIDGGKGQVNAVVGVLDDLGMSEIPVIGLAKRLEEIVFPGEGESLLLPEHSPALQLLIAIRDECHRFATSANQNLRSKEVAFTLLESIKGVGEQRSRKLMQVYGSVDAILASSPEEIASQAGIPVPVAKRLIDKLSL